MEERRWSATSPPPRGLVPPVRVDPVGRSGPTPGQARGLGWRRTSRGFYVPAPSAAPDATAQRIVEQAARLPPFGAVTGWASLHLAGTGFLDGLARDGRIRCPVPLALGPDRRIRADAGVALSREPLGEDEVVVRHGVRCTTVVRALFDEMRSRDPREAVVAMDMTAAADLVSVRQMNTYLEAHSRWRRSSVVRRALPLSSELSRSPNETRMRLVWRLDARLPAPLVNQDVFSRDGRLLGVVDLLDPVAGLVGEYDGAHHRSARRHSADTAREHALRDHGLEYVALTGPDLGRPGPSAQRALTGHVGDRGVPQLRPARTERARTPQVPSPPADGHGSRSRRLTRRSER